MAPFLVFHILLQQKRQLGDTGSCLLLFIFFYNYNFITQKKNVHVVLSRFRSFQVAFFDKKVSFHKTGRFLPCLPPAAAGSPFLLFPSGWNQMTADYHLLSSTCSSSSNASCILIFSIIYKLHFPFQIGQSRLIKRQIFHVTRNIRPTSRRGFRHTSCLFR